MHADIPVVSFAPFLHGTKAERHTVAKEVYDAFARIGFVYLKDHGIAQSELETIFAESNNFFSLSMAQKSTYTLTDAGLNQGYTADGAEGIGDHKECYEHRRFQNPNCPSSAVLPSFKSNLDTFYTHCLTLAMQVLKCLALSLDLGENFFDKITTKADPQMRLLHYPRIHPSELEKPGHSRINAHTDFGLCTLLFQDDTGGLEIDPFHTGHFTPAPPIKGTCLVNIGDLMTRLTNGRAKSTMHRVRTPQHVQQRTVDGDGMLPARYSIPFFVHPDPETLIDPITLEQGEVKKYKAVQAGEWRDRNTRRNYGLDGVDKKSLSKDENEKDLM